MNWDESRYYPSAEISRADWEDPKKQAAFIAQMRKDLIASVRLYGYKPTSQTYIRSVTGDDPVTVTLNICMGRETPNYGPPTPPVDA